MENDWYDEIKNQVEHVENLHTESWRSGRPSWLEPSVATQPRWCTGSSKPATRSLAETSAVRATFYTSNNLLVEGAA